MGKRVAPGLHPAPGRPIAPAAYEQYIGRWSRLFVPALLAAAEVTAGCRVLDVATGAGEAALGAMSVVTAAGRVVGGDISPALLVGARAPRGGGGVGPVATDGQALPFKHGTFDAVVCQLGLQFFADRARGLLEFRRVLRPGGCAAACVVSTPDRAPMWGVLADALGRRLPEQRDTLHLSFALADADRLERLLESAGVCDVRVMREKWSGALDNLPAYWAPLAARTRHLPPVYHS